MRLLLSVLRNLIFPRHMLGMLEPSLGTKASTEWEPDGEAWGSREASVTILGHSMWLSLQGGGWGGWKLSVNEFIS